MNKVEQYCHKNRQVNKWNQIKDLDVSLHAYRCLIFNIISNVKNKKCRKEIIFNKRC